jgi:alpha-1,2-mannosyltransferase
VRTRLPLLAVTVALIAYHLLSFGRHGIGLGPYHIDLDVYRIGSLTWLHGASLYGTLPRTRAGIGLPFSYPPMAAVLMSPLAVVPMAVAGAVLTLASVALTWVVLRVFTRSLASRISLCWLLPAALALEPVRATLNFGQVNIVLMALVAADCLYPRPRWPRGALVGLAAAVKLTPMAFVLFFLLRGDRRAAGTAAASFAAVTGTGFILDGRDSPRYWTSVVFSTSRPGSPAFVGNQAISGVLARSGLDPHSLGGAVAWLALSGAVVLIAATGMRRALAGGEPALALSVNALAALLISPISWSHHWVWAAPALLCLAAAGRRHSWRGGTAAAWAGLVLFEVSPMWLLPRSGAMAELGWAWWEQVTGDTYVIYGFVVLGLAMRFTPRSAALTREGERSVAGSRGGVVAQVEHAVVVRLAAGQGVLPGRGAVEQLRALAPGQRVDEQVQLVHQPVGQHGPH